MRMEREPAESVELVVRHGMELEGEDSISCVAAKVVTKDLWI